MYVFLNSLNNIKMIKKKQEKRNLFFKKDVSR